MAACRVRHAACRGDPAVRAPRPEGGRHVGRRRVGHDSADRRRVGRRCESARLPFPSRARATAIGRARVSSAGERRSARSARRLERRPPRLLRPRSALRRVQPPPLVFSGAVGVAAEAARRSRPRPAGPTAELASRRAGSVPMSRPRRPPSRPQPRMERLPWVGRRRSAADRADGADAGVVAGAFPAVFPQQGSRPLAGSPGCPGLEDLSQERPVRAALPSVALRSRAFARRISQASL